MTGSDPAADLLRALEETLAQARHLREALALERDPAERARLTAERARLTADLRDTLSQLSTLLSEIDAMGGMDFLFASPLGRA
jgi:signal transduction histidine kinase